MLNMGVWVRLLVFFMMLGITGVWTASAQTGMYYQIPAKEYAALKALYASLNGDNWGLKSGWNLPEVDNWSGVQVSGAVKAYDSALGRYKIVKKGHVTLLSLNDANLKGFIPSTIKDLTELKTLGIQSNVFNGSIPSEIGQLSKLKSLDLWLNFKGELPSSMAALSELESLIVVGNVFPTSPPGQGYDEEMTGALPTWLPSLNKLTHLWLHGRFTGPIPDNLGQIGSLKELNLTFNRLTGSIPDSLGDLSDLEKLDLSYGQLSGSLPMGLADLGNLLSLILPSNELSGSIPDWLGTMPKLEYLVLRDNEFSGAIPLSLGNLKSTTKEDKSVYILLNSNCLDLENAPAIRIDLPDASVFSYSPQSDCTPPDLPDLRSTLMEVVQVEVQSNDKITINFQIENLGPGDAEGYRVAFYLATDPNEIDTQSEHLETIMMPALSANESTTVQTIEIELPLTIANAGAVDSPNQFTIGIIVDPFDQIAEENEENNYRPVLGVGYDMIKIFGPPIIEMIQFDAHHVDHAGEGFIPGQTMLVEWWLQNVGYGKAEPFLLEFLFDPPIGSDVSDGYLGNTAIADGLESGEMDFGDFIVSLPIDFSDVYEPFGNGTYLVKPELEPKSLEIFDFGDPYFTGDEVYGDYIVIMGICVDLKNPQIQIHNYYGNFQPGEEVPFEFNFKNESPVHLQDPFTVAVYLSTDPVIDPATDLQVYTKVIQNVNPRVTHRVLSQKFTLPPANDPFWFAGGPTYYVGLVVDLFEEVNECDRTNNISSGLGNSSFLLGSGTQTVSSGGNSPTGNGSSQQPYQFPARGPVDLDCTPGARFQMEALEARPLDLMEIIVEKQSGSGTIYFTADGSPPNPENYIYKLVVDPDDPGPYTVFISSGDGELRATVDMPGGLTGGTLEVMQKEPPVLGESHVTEFRDTEGMFGSSVAVSGGRLAIGSLSIAEPPDYQQKTGAGLYEWIGEDWQRTADSPFAGGGRSYYGSSVGLSGNFLIVGDSAAGRIYSYRRNGADWDQQIITLPDGSYLADISVSGDRFAAGVQHYHGINDSAVLVYDWSGSNWDLSVVDRVEGPNRGFGVRVSLSGDTLAVIDNKDAGQTSHIFRRVEGVWIHTNRGSGDEIGYSTEYVLNPSTSGDVVAVGSPGTGIGPGVVFIYRWDGTDWNRSFLRAPEADSAPGLYFGGHVAISGDRIAVTSNGYLYVFESNGTEWDQIGRLEGVLSHNKIAFDGDLILVGILQFGGLNAMTGKVFNLAEVLKKTVAPERWPTSDIRRVGDALLVDTFRQPDTEVLLVLSMTSPNLDDWAQVQPDATLIDTDPDTGIETWRSTIPLEPDTKDTFIRVFVQE